MVTQAHKSQKEALVVLSPAQNLLSAQDTLSAAAPIRDDKGQSAKVRSEYELWKCFVPRPANVAWELERDNLPPKVIKLVIQNCLMHEVLEGRVFRLYTAQRLDSCATSSVSEETIPIWSSSNKDLSIW